MFVILFQRHTQKSKFKAIVSVKNHLKDKKLRKMYPIWSLKQNNPLKINELLSKFGCLTWIRTKTNCTKNSRATVTQSGNPIPFFEWSAKIGVSVKFSK
jgi:hypothetical protein